MRRVGPGDQRRSRFGSWISHICWLIMHSGTGNSSVRLPAVAGLFYPDDPRELRTTVRKYLSHARAVDLPAPPRAYIVPHAAYVYSGSVAACCYALIAAQRNSIRRVVLIGPSHHTCAVRHFRKPMCSGHYSATSRSISAPSSVCGSDVMSANLMCRTRWIATPLAADDCAILMIDHQEETGIRRRQSSKDRRVQRW